MHESVHDQEICVHESAELQVLTKVRQIPDILWGKYVMIGACFLTLHHTLYIGSKRKLFRNPDRLFLVFISSYSVTCWSSMSYTLQKPFNAWEIAAHAVFASSLSSMGPSERQYARHCRPWALMKGSKEQLHVTSQPPQEADTWLWGFCHQIRWAFPIFPLKGFRSICHSFSLPDFPSI